MSFIRMLICHISSYSILLYLAEYLRGLIKLDLRAYVDAISPYMRLILLFRAPKKCRLYFIWQGYDTKKLLYRLSYG
jgi:hypothetical protein